MGERMIADLIVLFCCLSIHEYCTSFKSFFCTF